MHDQQLEARMRTECAAGNHAAATSLLIAHYGGEILAFLSARLRSPSDGEEVFATFAEKLWVGLPNFEWRCSSKAWAYCLARNAANDFAVAAQNRPRHNLALSSQLPQAMIDLVRTTTALYRQTPIKDRMRELRETLPLDDQMLLILRVDRNMAWRDLAVALDGTVTDAESMTADSAELDRAAARVRKRFERIKTQLRDLARAEGLLPDGS